MSKKISTLIVSLVLFAIVGMFSCIVVHARDQNTPAMDTSIIPSAEVCLTKLTISDDADHTVNLSGLGFTPTILQVRADGNFHEGRVAPVQSNDIWRDSGTIWSLPVSGAVTWHFARQSGAGTVNIYIKVLGSN